MKINRIHDFKNQINGTAILNIQREKNYFLKTRIYYFLILILNYFLNILTEFKNLAKRFKIAYKLFIRMYVHAFRFQRNVPLYKVQYYADKRGFVIALNNLWFFQKYLHIFCIEEQQIFIKFLEFHFHYWEEALKRKNFRFLLEKTWGYFKKNPLEQNDLFNNILNKEFAENLYIKLKLLNNPLPSLYFTNKKLFKRKKSKK